MVPVMREIIEDVLEFCSPSSPTVELIFFHGIQLGKESAKDLHLTTWTTKGSADRYWPQTFFEEDNFLRNRNIRVRALTFRYDGSKYKTATEGRLDEYLIAEAFAQTIINLRVDVGQKKGVPVILVCHSFGGLIVKNFLNRVDDDARMKKEDTRLRSFLDNVAGVFFYSTPHVALKEETFDALFPKLMGKQQKYSKLVRLLQQLNKDVARLEENFQKRIQAQKFGKNWGGVRQLGVFESNETDLGFWTGMILEEGSGRGFVDEANIIMEDHFNVCRPANLNSQSYQRLATFLSELIPEQDRNAASGS